MVKKFVGVLTAGGDCPGLNAAIRGVGKAARSLDIEVIGYLDGFRGLVENRFIRLDSSRLSGILTVGGTILGTSRDKPHKMPAGELGTIDMRPFAVANYEKQHLDCLVCLGGGGTQKNARRLMKEGLNVVTLPKTIDNDVWGTDVTFGFDTAMAIATEAIDRLHSTAESHHRIIVVEIMGHNAGWLALGAGVAGGADVILIPEIPYDIEKVADAVLHRSYAGKRFSIIAMSEGATSKDEAEALGEGVHGSGELAHESVSMRLARRLEELTRLESRVTSLGHLQRGGVPSPTDRLLATRLGTACARFIAEDRYGVMVAVQGDDCVPVKLKKVAGKRRIVPLDHPWVESARLVGTSFGD
ncbi:MAG: 6-phosphofructokinase [Anaerolineae bacterium]|nr:6-phosphofructokinase [Anaerolineae bacterium]